MENGMLDRTGEYDIEWMVEAYGEYVYRLAYEFTCDPVDAEDVTYAAFLSARELSGHISECDRVADILYDITSAVAHVRLESNLNAERVNCSRELVGDYLDGSEVYMDASLARFRPGLEAARSALGAYYGYCGYSI